MTTYTERFTEVLGDITEPIYRELIGQEINERHFDLMSPPARIASEFGSAIRYALEPWREYELPESGVTPRMVWYLDSGKLSIALATLDEICKLLRDNDRPSLRLLAEPADVILARIDEQAEALLNVLHKIQRSEIPVLAEELFTEVVKFHLRHHTEEQTDALYKAREFCSLLWLEGPSTTLLKCFLENAQMISMAFSDGARANELAARLLKLQEELEVEELWSKLTRA